MTRLGFVGTGTISEAIVRGINRNGIADHKILVSPRNADLAAALAAEFGNVQIAASNQDVIDGSDVVFLAVRPQIVREVVPGLVFGAHQTVVSLVATIGMVELAKLVAPAHDLVRAVPLPFVALGLGPTLVHPPHPIIAQLFDSLGRAIVVERESEIDVMMAASCTMGAYFATMGWVQNWMSGHGIDADLSRSYLSMISYGLADAAQRHPERDFAALSTEYSTRGGLNEQFRTGLEQAGVPTAYQAGFDALLTRMTGGAKPVD